MRPDLTNQADRFQVHRQLTGSSFLQLCGGKAIQRRLEDLLRPRYQTDPVDAIPRLRLMANSRSKTMNWRLGSSYARLTELSVICKDRKKGQISVPGMDVGSDIGSIGSESGSRRQSIAGHPASGTSLHANSPRPILHVCVTNYPITNLYTLNYFF